MHTSCTWTQDFLALQRLALLNPLHTGNTVPKMTYCCRPICHVQVCIVTGGNAGIGFATAELLAARGAHVVMACRSKERGQAAATTLLRRVQPLPGCQLPTVEVMQVDMASLASVREFCREFEARHLPLHLVVANAGIMSPAQRLETEDGLEMQFQVNFLSHWLMVQRLLAQQRSRRAAAAAAGGQTSPYHHHHHHHHHSPAVAHIGSASPQGSSSSAAGGGGGNGLATPPSGTQGSSLVASGEKAAVLRVKEGALDEVGSGGGGAAFGLRDDGTRVVMVTSLTHKAGILNWHDMQSRQAYDPFTSYGLSKLANALTATELQRRFQAHAGDPQAWGQDSAVAVHPGLVETHLATNFFKNQGVVEAVPASAKLISGLVDAVGPLVMKSPANSARVVAFAALAPAQQVAGRYIADSRVAAASPAVSSPRLAKELWEVAEQLTGEVTHESLRAASQPGRS
ncbi:hypothetical protein V8C86DRAFT_968708 [Haematococcus lacustris]